MSRYNTLINELLLMQFYLFKFFLNCIIGSDENYASHCLSHALVIIGTPMQFEKRKRDKST